jgi:hypothetical protein
VAVIFSTVLLQPSSSRADFTYSTGAVTVGGEPVSAVANIHFDVTNQTITVVLTNLQGGIHTAGQAISGFDFTVSPGISNATLLSTAGQLVKVNSGPGGTPLNVDALGSAFTGATTYSGTGGATPLTDGRWHITSGSNLLALTGGQPDHMILGEPGSNGMYGDNIQDQFDPYFRSQVTLTMSVTGLTANSSISYAQFYFGTGPDGSAPGYGGLTHTNPAPASAVLALSGVLSMGVGRMWKTRRRVAKSEA